MDTITNFYRDKLKELRLQLGATLPPEVLKIFDADAENSNSAHTNVLKLKTGNRAPDFELPNATGKTIRLSEVLKSNRVVMIFYRGAWCPYCNLQLMHYQSALNEINASGAVLLAISPQTPDASLDLAEKNALGFEVLNDTGNIVAEKFTTVLKNDHRLINTMAGLGIDFHNYYADDQAELPVPAVFVIEKDLTISFAKSEGGDYRNRVDASEIIHVLKQEKNEQ